MKMMPLCCWHVFFLDPFPLISCFLVLDFDEFFKISKRSQLKATLTIFSIYEYWVVQILNGVPIIEFSCTSRLLAFPGLKAVVVYLSIPGWVSECQELAVFFQPPFLIKKKMFAFFIFIVSQQLGHPFLTDQIKCTQKSVLPKFWQEWCTFSYLSWSES